MKATRSGLLALACCLLGAVRPEVAHAVAIVRSATSPDAAGLQAAIDNFRADLGGANNGVGGSFATGRREINWDGVPDSFSVPNFMPGDFFNANSPRGVVFSSVEGASALNQFLVSADSDNPTLTPVRFANFNAANSTIFQTFSAQRLFQVRSGDTLEVTFFVPGTNIPASVSGFGVVFADVDNGTRIRLDCYAGDATKLSSATGAVLNNGLSFLGFFFPDSSERCARIEVRAGNTPIDSGSADGAGSVDLVAMDDFIYGEPHSLDGVLADGFE